MDTKPEDLRSQLARLEQEQDNQCVVELRAVLDKYNRQLVGVPVITPDGRIGANVQLVPKQPQ